MIDVGLGFFVEMTLVEAIAFLDQKEGLYERRAEAVSKTAAAIAGSTNLPTSIAGNSLFIYST